MEAYIEDNYFGQGLLISWNGFDCPCFTIKEIGEDYEKYKHCMKHIGGIYETTLWKKKELLELPDEQKKELIELLKTENERFEKRLKRWQNKSFMPSI